MGADRSFNSIAQHAARPVDADDALDRIAARAARGSVVLIGEASHGTQDFYAMRAAVTRRLIADHGFRAVGLEADWPDTFRAHRYATGRSDDANAVEALADFRRFPAWMWRNETMRDFVEWLADFNRSRPDGDAAGVFGLDLYSLHASIEAVLHYLDDVDPAAAARARARYACFEYFGDSAQGYGLAVTHGAESCEDEVVAQLSDLRRQALALPRGGGQSVNEEFFSAEQNARLVMNAERYYRAMFRGRESTWNLRDTHMAETLDALRERMPGALERCGRVGAQLASRRCAGPPRWAAAANTISGSSRVNATAAKHSPSAFQRTRVPSPRRPTGTRRWNASAFARARGQLRAHVSRKPPGSILDRPLRARSRAGARRASVAARDRRDLSTRNRALESLFRSAAASLSSTLLIHLDRTEALRPLEPQRRLGRGRTAGNVADGAVSFAWKQVWIGVRAGFALFDALRRFALDCAVAVATERRAPFPAHHRGSSCAAH